MPRSAKSLSPAQQVIKIVNEELIETLGGTTGKLTTVVEAAQRRDDGGPAGLRKDDRLRASSLASSRARTAGRSSWVPTSSAPPRSSSCRVLGERIGVPVYSEATDADLGRHAAHAKKLPASDATSIIVDTAGRSPDRRRPHGRAASRSATSCSPTTRCSSSTR